MGNRWIFPAGCPLYFTAMKTFKNATDFGKFQPNSFEEFWTAGTTHIIQMRGTRGRPDKMPPPFTSKERVMGVFAKEHNYRGHSGKMPPLSNLRKWPKGLTSGIVDCVYKIPHVALVVAN